MCYNTCPYFRKDTELCKLPNGVSCPYDEESWPAWPPTMEEYGSYCACRGCPYEVPWEDECTLADPKTHCIRKCSIMVEMYPEAPGHVCE